MNAILVSSSPPQLLHESRLSAPFANSPCSGPAFFFCAPSLPSLILNGQFHRKTPLIRQFPLSPLSLTVKCHLSTAFSMPSSMDGKIKKSLKTAVIGAGAAGLVAARELLRAGHEVTVFEQSTDVGGVWAYDPRTDGDPLGAECSPEPNHRATPNPNPSPDSDEVNRKEGRKRGQKVHSSMYSSLRTNLPRELMAFTDFSFGGKVPANGREWEGEQKTERREAWKKKSGENVGNGGVFGDARRFPGHEEVYRYLRSFCEEYELEERIVFATRVEDVCLEEEEPVEEEEGEGKRNVVLNAASPSRTVCSAGGEGVEEGDAMGGLLNETEELVWPRWRVTTVGVGCEGDEERRDEEDGESKGRMGRRGERRVEVYDAIVVCNGHYSQPRVAEIPGIRDWPGTQVHSHNYRHPEPFSDLVVVVIGGAASGEDISIEIADVAREVHVSVRGGEQSGEEGGGFHRGRKGNISRHGEVVLAHGDGSVEFSGGRKVVADVILHCTGYSYSFPFLRKMRPHVDVEDNRVGLLFQHVFPPSLSPTLSFIGLPWKVIPFPLCELQSKWVAGILSERIALPARSKMLRSVKQFHESMRAAGIPLRFSHRLDMEQFAYMDWLALECECQNLEPWRAEMYARIRWEKKVYPLDYRDKLDHPSH